MSFGVGRLDSPPNPAMRIGTYIEKSDAWLLSVADDVYAGIDLSSKNPHDGFRALLMQAPLVDWFACLLLQQQLGKRGRPRKASAMCCQNTFV